MPTTLVATPEPSNVPPRVKLDLTWTGATEATIVRTDPDGRVRTVRGADPVEVSSDVALVYDYESFFGESTTYEAIVGASSVTSSAVTLAADDVWLRHPGIPSLSQIVELAGDGEPTFAVNRAVFQPLGRRYPIAVTDGVRKAATGELKLRTYTAADRDDLEALLADASVLLLDLPPDLGYRMPVHQYLSFGDLTVTPLVAANPRNVWLEWTLPYHRVERPAGGLQALRTYADLLTEASTYLELRSLYDDYAEVLSGSA